MMQLALDEFLLRYEPLPTGHEPHGGCLMPYYWLRHHYGTLLTVEDVDAICALIDPMDNNDLWRPKDSSISISQEEPRKVLSEPAPEEPPAPKPAAWLTTVTIEVLSTDGPIDNVDIRTVLDLADMGESYMVLRHTKAAEILDQERLQKVRDAVYSGGTYAGD